MASHVIAASVLGLDAHPVSVETDISPGLPAFVIVGLPDIAVQEARDRVKSALRHADIEFPRTRVTVNLAPADLKKVGTPFDLPIALGVMAAHGDLAESALANVMFAGELGLDGSLRPIHGALSFALLAKQSGLEELILPAANAPEAALVKGLRVCGASHVRDVISHIRGQNSLIVETGRDLLPEALPASGLDFASIRGQGQARRALEIAAAGGHNVLMQGPPGSGKTLLARAFPTILPWLTSEEALEATRIHSVAGLLPPEGMVRQRPFRAPHHSASGVALVGGGAIPKPGEISLAHRGVLFLDEFLEFPRHVLEALRQPLEDGSVTVSRAQGTLTFPARFTLLGAMNPCPCGYLTDPDRTCSCTPIMIAKYRKRLSGPLLDRMDLFIEVPKVPTAELTDVSPGETSLAIRGRVQAARDRQTARLAELGLATNAELTSEHVRRIIRLEPEAGTVLRHAVERYRLSARAYFRLLKVSQTIADLAGEERIHAGHVGEALLYRYDQV
ncbi:MAG TPA: YifB family Mg chelatase-like AAA ATPase [Verrucomicrobiae bacterium]|nr:YifB family Mg chelatase-like AAA ATPase [Verrucomicrobiae bacterium]